MGALAGAGALNGEPRLDDCGRVRRPFFLCLSSETPKGKRHARLTKPDATPKSVSAPLHLTGDGCHAASTLLGAIAFSIVLSLCGLIGPMEQNRSLPQRDIHLEMAHIV